MSLYIYIYWRLILWTIADVSFVEKAKILTDLKFHMEEEKCHLLTQMTLTLHRHTYIYIYIYIYRVQRVKNCARYLEQCRLRPWVPHIKLKVFQAYNDREDRKLFVAMCFLLLHCTIYVCVCVCVCVCVWTEFSTNFCSYPLLYLSIYLSSLFIFNYLLSSYLIID